MELSGKEPPHRRVLNPSTDCVNLELFPLHLCQTDHSNGFQVGPRSHQPFAHVCPPQLVEGKPLVSRASCSKHHQARSLSRKRASNATHLLVSPDEMRYSSVVSIRWPRRLLRSLVGLCSVNQTPFADSPCCSLILPRYATAFPGQTRTFAHPCSVPGSVLRVLSRHNHALDEEARSNKGRGVDKRQPRRASKQPRGGDWRRRQVSFARLSNNSHGFRWSFGRAAVSRAAMCAHDATRGGLGGSK